MKQYFIMRYRQKRGEWMICGDKGHQLLSSFEAQKALHYLVKKFPKQIYKLGVQV